ncbi:MAG: sigma-54-dependent Fis family transcriptional regulator [Verrucomicrobia bacterium]|nr:MAG: sigma-54-dependent Fis family transcriptional regulator [Verrucomicrobiota bacterium]
MSKILIVEDDAGFASSLAEAVRDFGYEVTIAPSGEDALARFDEIGAALVFLDLRLRGMHGLEVLRALKSHPDRASTPVVILTAFADSANTIEAMKLGAFDHLTKPIGRDDIRAVLARALTHPPTIAAGKIDISSADELIGSSLPMREVQKLIGLAASSDATVLVLGETGTGKELVARAVHCHSERARRPFVAVNCAAIPAELLESELFGHVRGAFTGALQARAGRFREADGGTLFLDEIGDMTSAMQAKMLRALQDRAITPVGGSSVQHVDVRVIAATRHDLAALVREEKFREDLFYRLNVLRIELPPLRERGSDILLLAEHFLRRALPDAPKKLSTAAAKSLLEHTWPGNVRELENLMRSLSLTVRGVAIDHGDLDFETALTPGDSIDELLALDLPAATARLEKMLLQKAFRKTGNNRAEAARRLGIRRQFLYTKLKEHGL